MSASILLFWALALLFNACGFGQKLTDQFELLEYELYKRKWYLFPIELQRTFVFAMMNVQEVVVVLGFGNIEITHETSRKVPNE